MLTDLYREESKASAAPLNRRLYLILRGAILANRLPVGSQLPSTRTLASELNLSRNTVLSAINQLLAEGYLTARQGSGTFVADMLPDSTPAGFAATAGLPPKNRLSPPPLDPQRRNLSRRGKTLTRTSGAADFEVLPFAESGTPLDLSEFPVAIWQKLQAKHWRYLNRNLLDYGNDGGLKSLKRSLAQYLTLSRSVRVAPEQIIITAGTQQAIDLAARMLTDHGDTAWVENPCYWGASRALEAAGLKLHPIAVDADGIAPTAEDWATTPRLIYVTPSHQYPLGRVMSLARRRALLDFAASRRCWIFEDDYDSEFRYSGRPFASLQGLDDHAQVIYAGTFSKVMYPGMRLGYLVLPPDLVDAFNTGLYDLYRPGHLILQAALADFMDEGHYNTLVRRLRVAYRQRRDALTQVIAQQLGTRVRITGEDSGLHLCLLFADQSVDDERVAEACAQTGLSVRPLSRYYLAPPAQRGLIVGYAYVPSEKIQPAAVKLAGVLARYLEVSKAA
ncbi:MAG: PLP-dependent aminotransferase family protein [Burkholderiaceae bacterium]